MNEVLILRLRCGIPGCEWALPIPEPTPFSPAGLTKIYGRFRQHCAERHHLNLETNELPGVDHAALFVDGSRGSCVEILMDSVIEEVEFGNSFEFEASSEPPTGPVN